MANEAPRPMTGFMATLSDDQKERALAYDGPETIGVTQAPEWATRMAEEAHGRFADSRVKDNLTTIIALALTEAHAKGLEEAWQPIETAPRDGTDILAWNAFMGVYNTSFVAGEFPCGFSSGHSATWFPKPTHWMPLPPPPAIQNLKGKQ